MRWILDLRERASAPQALMHRLGSSEILGPRKLRGDSSPAIGFSQISTRFAPCGVSEAKAWYVALAAKILRVALSLILMISLSVLRRSALHLVLRLGVLHLKLNHCCNHLPTLAL